MLDDSGTQYHELQNLEDGGPRASANEPLSNKVGLQHWILRLIQGFHGLNLGILYVALFPYLELLGLDKRSIGALMSISLVGNGFLRYFLPQLKNRSTHKTLILSCHGLAALCGAILLTIPHKWAALPAIIGCMVSWGQELGFLRTLEGNMLITITNENKQFEERTLSLLLGTSGASLGMIATTIMLSVDEQLSEPPRFDYAFKTFTVLELVILFLVFFLDSRTHNETKTHEEMQVSTQEEDDEEEETTSVNDHSRVISCLNWTFFLQAIGEGIVLIPWKVDYMSVMNKDPSRAPFAVAMLLIGDQFSPVLSVVLTYLLQGPIKSVIIMELTTAFMYIGVGSSSQPDTTKTITGISVWMTSRLYYVHGMVLSLVAPQNSRKELLARIFVYRAFGLCIGPLVAGALAYHDLYGYCYYISATLLLLCCMVLAFTCLPLDENLRSPLKKNI